MDYLEKKRVEVLAAIKPICQAFNITDYDYEISNEGQREILRLGDVKIGCSCNSIFAIKNELIGYIFIKRWCKYNNLGAFATQTKNAIKRYWI